MVIPFDKKAENRASIFVEIVIESKSDSYPPVLWRTAISFAETWDKWEDKGIYEKDDCAYRFNSATTLKTETIQFIGHKL